MGSCRPDALDPLRRLNVTFSNTRRHNTLRRSLFRIRTYVLHIISLNHTAALTSYPVPRLASPAQLSTFISRSLSSLFPTSSHLLATQDPKAAKFSDHYTLAFTLLLEDVTEGDNPTSWDIERSLRGTSQPHRISHTSVQRVLIRLIWSCSFF